MKQKTVLQSFWIALVWSLILTQALQTFGAVTKQSRARIKVLFFFWFCFWIHFTFIRSTFKQTKGPDTWIGHVVLVRTTTGSLPKPTTFLIASTRKVPLRQLLKLICSWLEISPLWISHFQSWEKIMNESHSLWIFTQIKLWGVCSISADIL